MQIYRVLPWFFHCYVWWQWRVVILCNSIDEVDKTGAGACHMMPHKKNSWNWQEGTNFTILMAYINFRSVFLLRCCLFAFWDCQSFSRVKRSSHAISFPKCLPQLPWPGNFVPHRPQRKALHVRTDPIAVLAPEKESWPALKTGELTKT